MIYQEIVLLLYKSSTQFICSLTWNVKFKVIYHSSTITKKKEVSASTVDCFMIWLNSDVILFDWAIITLQPVRKIGKVTGHSMLHSRRTSLPLYQYKHF